MHPYSSKKVALSTMHGKEEAIRPPFEAELNVSIEVPLHIDTDKLGTFSGEVERRGTLLETLRNKAKLGMEELGLPLGLASEGSFGPHHAFPMVPEDHEMLLWVDKDRGIEVLEQEISLETNFQSVTVSTWDELTDFMKKVHFPSHALVIKPNLADVPEFTYKGLKDPTDVKAALAKCTDVSKDKKALVLTDMRAHMNPSRMLVIHKLAQKMAKRLVNQCPKCSCPGWGKVDIVRGLPCEGCGLKTNQVAEEVFGCPSCDYKLSVPRSDGLTKASPATCDWCNP